MNVRSIAWEEGKIKLIDQTLLPGKFRYIHVSTLKDLWEAIKLLKVRGAPALGAAAALGVYLGIKDSGAHDGRALEAQARTVAAYLATSRPTARNLFWGLERMLRCLHDHRRLPVDQIKRLLLAEAQAVIEEDRASCRSIGAYGSKLIKRGATVMTVCNAGALATIDYGTALGVIYRATEEGKKIKVFSCETRPLLQGARLTTWELQRNGVDVTLICDNMAASVMQQGTVDLVIAGADRIAANGDTANKIGTYSLAVLAAYHKIPFYIAAPASTFDCSMKTGKDIPIEQRSASEVTSLFYKTPMVAAGVKVYNPAFDVTPHHLISAIITDKGLVYPPFARTIKKVLK